MQHDTTTATAIYRVLKARTELIVSRRFYGVLVSNVEPMPSRKFPTMATDGKRHFFNPEFICELTQAEVLGVQAHETEHDARRHHSRRAGRDPQKWNEACDYAINLDLIDEGFVLPKGALIDERFRGMSAEDIYRTRELDEQRQQQQQQEQDDDGEEDEEGASGQDRESYSDDQDRESYSSDDEETGDDADADGAGDPSDDEGVDEGEASSGGGDSEGAEPGTSGAGEDDAGPDEPASAGGGGSEAGDVEAVGQQSSGDPGGCGEVLDASNDANEVEQADIDWERTVRQAASMAKAVGELPGHITREIDRANNPDRDWREEFRAWLDYGALRIETWNRRNRRFSDIILPGSKKLGVRKAVFLIDTSGSMDDVALRCVNTEAQGALDDGIIDEVIVVYGDKRVTRVDEYRTGDDMTFDPRGGGGTNLRPLFDYAANEHADATLIICFTDMEFGDLGEEPACPVLFAATGYPDKVRQYLANAPWGAPGIDVGAH